MRFRAVNFYYFYSEALDFFIAILYPSFTTNKLSLNSPFRLPDLISPRFINLPPIISCIDLTHYTRFSGGQTNAIY